MDHHRLGRGQRLGMSKAGAGGFNRTARVMLFEMRWREPPPETGLRVTAWFVSITLHLLVAAAMLIYRPPAWVPPGGGGSEDGAIQVRLIERPVEPARTAPPPPVKLPPQVPREGSQTRAPRRGAVSLPAIPRELPRVETPKVETAVAPPPTDVTAPRPQTRVAAVAPSAPEAEPAPPRPAPPRIVPEASPMSVPPPTVKAPAMTALRPTAATDDIAPVPVDRTGPRTEAPQLAVSAPRDEHPAPAPVSPRAVAPAPQPLAPVPLAADRPAPPRLQAPALTAPETPAPPVARAHPQVAAPEAPALPGTDMSAPRAEAPRVSLPAALPDAVEGPLSVPPVEVVAAPPRPAPSPTVTTAPPKPSATSASDRSWADTSASDRFHGAQAPAARRGLKMYGKDGSLALTGGAGGGATPEYIQRLPQGNTDVMSRSGSHIHYRATRFEQYWVPYGRSALDDALERLIDKLTVTKKIDLNSGIHGECKFSPLLFVAIIGCGANPPPTPLDTSNDKRLDMAPARPLVPGLDKPAPAPPASATMPQRDDVSCATARVAGSPPPPGCPGSGKAADQW